MFYIYAQNEGQLFFSIGIVSMLLRDAFPSNLVRASSYTCSLINFPH